MGRNLQRGGAWATGRAARLGPSATRKTLPRQRVAPAHQTDTWRRSNCATQKTHLPEAAPASAPPPVCPPRYALLCQCRRRKCDHPNETTSETVLKAVRKNVRVLS